VLTFQVLGFLALSLFFQSLIPLISRAFFALHNTWVPFISGLIAAVVNITLAFLLSKTMGIGGVALAFSISQTLNLLIMLVILHVRLKGFEDQKILSTITKIVLASIAMGIAIQAAKYITGLNIGTDTSFKIFAQTAISSFGGVVTFLILAWCLGIKEVGAVKILLGKLVKK
jgi:putative peptidoglycan lipid II flippase